MPDPTKDQKDVMEAVAALRDLAHKQHGKTDAEVKEVSETVEKFLQEQETKNQQYLSDVKDAETKAKETQERMDAIEIELAHRKDAGIITDYKSTTEFKTIEAFAKGGPEAVAELEQELKATLRTDIDPQGGYLVQGEMDNVITKKITEISGLRSVARVRTIASKSLAMPIRTGIATAAYEGEAEAGGESNSAYGSESLTAFRLSVTIPITLDMLMDSSFNMESEIFNDAAEAFAQKEGNKFILGTNAKQPEGILVNPAVVAGAMVSGTSGTITADDMLLLTGELKTGYNPTYIMNRKTLAFLRTLKSTDGVFLWQPGMNGSVANNINGFNYVLAQDMPDIAGNSLSVAFGDFQRGYTIIDRTGVSMVRDEYTSKKNAIVEFTIHRWNYGKVTLAEAITLLKTAP